MWLRLSLQCWDRFQTLSRAVEDAAIARLRFEIKTRSCGARHGRGHRTIAWREPCSGPTRRARDRADFAYWSAEIDGSRRSPAADFARSHWFPARPAIECCGAFEHSRKIFATVAYSGRKRSSSARKRTESAESRTPGGGTANLRCGSREDRERSRVFGLARNVAAVWKWESAAPVSCT